MIIVIICGAGGIEATVVLGLRGSVSLPGFKTNFLKKILSKTL